MILFELNGREVGATEMHIPEVTQVISQWTVTALAPEVPEAKCRLSAQQHQERLARFRDESRQERDRIRARLAALGSLGDEEAESAVRTLLLEAETREHRAEADFWLLVGELKLPPDLHFVPFWSTKTFSAAECSTYALEEKGRRWYCALCVRLESEGAIGHAREKGLPWREVLKALLAVREDCEDADLAWDRYVALYRQATQRTGYRGTDAEAPMDSLAAWTTTLVSTARLLPSVARSQPGPKRYEPGAGRKRLRSGLLLEACGLAYSLRPDGLPVPRFRELPRKVASGMDKMHRDVGGQTYSDVGGQTYSDLSDLLDHLEPDERRRLQSLQRAESDPEVALLDGEGLALVQGVIASLPRRQQQAILLRAEGLSYVEIATQMGCEMESVKEHLERARKYTRPKLGRESRLDA